MRPPLSRSAFALLASFILASALPAGAQVKVDLSVPSASGTGASAASATGSIGTGATSLTGLTGATALNPGNSLLAPSLAAPANPGALALPSAAPALAPAAVLPAASSGAGQEKKPSAAAAAAAPPAGPPNEGPAAAAPAPPGNPPEPYILALQKLGVSEDLTGRLRDFLGTRHPGDQKSIYHGLGHSREVAGFTARIVENQDLSVDRKILLIFTAALHDVDPERLPDTPARVSATLIHLDQDPEARALLADYGRRFGFTTDQVKALIMATDFSPDPEELRAKLAAFDAAAKAAFPGEDFGLVWGRRLSFVDRASTYLSSEEEAESRVRGLAHEIRTNLQAIGKGPGPTDEQMLATTTKFLDTLKKSPDFELLPADLRTNFDKVHAMFEARQTPESWTNASKAPARSRAPPDVEAAIRYVRSIAAGITLTAKQADGILSVFFEENGIDPGSERAAIVRRSLVPGRAAADDAAVAPLSAPFAKRRGVMLRLAAQFHTTPAAVEAILTARGLMNHVSQVNDEQFEHQATLAMTRAELEAAVSRYPDTAQGRFMRELAVNMAARSGKSVEETSRDGVFAYVDFGGDLKVARARSGRNPDEKTSQMLFYVTREGRRWRVDGYRQNKDFRRKDAALIDAFKAWLTKGGVPTDDLE